MSNINNLHGYEQTDEIDSGGGKYLSFRKGDKGRVIKLRLCSQPKYVNQHWILGSDGKNTPVNCVGKNCAYCGEEVPVKEKIKKTAKWGWIVIDREDGTVKMFTGPTLIARQIRELVELAEWGNPFLYDISIKRVEGAGAGYYSTTPSPNGKGNEITAEEKEAVKEANIDISVELAGSKASDNTGNYGTPDLETVPDEQVDIPEDLVVDETEDISDEIPF